MSAHTTEDAFQAVRKSLELAIGRDHRSQSTARGREPYVCSTVGLKIDDLGTVLAELAKFRAAKSEHKRTRREIRRLAKFVQWTPESIVEAKRKLIDDNRALATRLDESAKENDRLTKRLRESQDRLSDVCDESARLASKANGYEDEHAKFMKAIAEALGVPEGETRSLVGVASELRRHANAKVNTNADVCAVEALEEMKARLEGMRETRDQATAKLADAEIERGKALHHAAVLRNDVASMTRAFEVRNARVDEVEKENTRLIRTLDAVRAAAKS